MSVPLSSGVPGRLMTIDAMYVRLRVGNRGNASALNAEVFANSLRRRTPEANWELVKGFPPMNLSWANIGGSYFPRIAPGMEMHCDIARVLDPVGAQAKWPETLKGGLDPSATTLTLMVIVHPNHKGNIVGPGTYQLDLTIAAENAKPIKRTLEVTLTGRWYSDDAQMLREGILVRLVGTQPLPANSR
jgi:hypothetical protein